MKRLVALALLVVLAVALLCLGASETLTNRSGKSASGVVITFSESVRISSYDESTFPDQNPSGRADTFTFTGGTLANGGRFSVSWPPSSAQVADATWIVAASHTATSAQSDDTGFPSEAGAAAIKLPQGNIMGAAIGGNWGDTPYYIDALPDDYFRFLVETGFTWVCISLSLVVDDSMDATVEIAGADKPFPGFTDSQLRRLIDRLHEAGLSVYLALAFENGDPAPAGKQVERWQFGDPYVYRWNAKVSKEYWPWDPAYPGHREFVDTFFRTYGDAAVHFAQIAEEKGVQLFSLGTETNRLFRTRPGDDEWWPTSFRDQLVELVQRVRAVYTNALSYDFNFDGLRTDIPPNNQSLWGDLDLDVIGISAYFPLLDAPAGSVPSVVMLAQKWQGIFDTYLKPLRAMYPEKEMLFLELGYTDGVGSAANPGADEFQRKVFVDRDKNGLDDGEEEQANILRALFETMERNPRVLKGGFLWGHQISPDAAWQRSFGAMRHYSVRGHLAETVVQEYAMRWQPDLSADNAHEVGSVTSSLGTASSGAQEETEALTFTRELSFIEPMPTAQELPVGLTSTS